MSTFAPPPTYADPVITDERTKRSQFNPLWLKWFLDIAAFVSASGGGTGGGIPHNSLTGLQGGGTGEMYHFTAAERSFILDLLRLPHVTATITTAKLTVDGANGSMTFTDGVLTAHTPAT